ncbi:MAG: DNA mismatch repair protein MutS [Treponema sp.]|nr:DNA mismatch repair protein MutS [Treponema sp.]
MAADTLQTPLMLQYQSFKRMYQTEVLFFRVGDFYEMFDDDAKQVSRLLNLTLTHKGDNPMCGIPYHAAKVYIARLLRLGKKIVICEQVGEVPSGKGLTERQVTEIITPGTAVESEYLDGGSNNYLAALSITHGKVGFAYIDVTTSTFMATSWSAASMAENFPKELGRCSPRELLLPKSLRDNPVIQETLANTPSLSISYYPDWDFSAELSYKRLIRQFNTVNLQSFALSETSPEVPPAGFLLDYLEKTTNAALPHVCSIRVYTDSEYMIIDDSSRRNLEIVSNLRDGSAQFTLLETVNYTLTAMGNRCLRRWLLSPLTDSAQIVARQEHVSLFHQNRNLLKEVRACLSSILDIERLAGRIAMERAHAKDLQALRTSLESWLTVRSSLMNYDFAAIQEESAQSIITMIQNALLDDPSTVLTEGGIIRPGWSQDLDHYRDVQTNFSNILDEYLEEEKQKTGIQNLKIKNSRNVGYYIEVTKGKLSSVPAHFIMRRALVNADRYTTERLQELEQELNESSTKIIETERNLFIELRTHLMQFVPYLMQVAHEIAYTDVTASLAQAAIEHNWIRPIVDDGTEFDVVGGRHPVVENHLPTGEFVPNDLKITTQDTSDSDAMSFALITGPNMAGKSTYLRQNALIIVLAQIGAFVPASQAHIGIVDRVFCRVGASDNLARGESTFLVEMTETAYILRSATSHSFVIMDEVGRGTSTEDGLSIAWAVSEYLLNTIRCKTLFATHYHELTRMEHPHLGLLCMDVLESEGSVIFLRKIKQGASENSYGIHVAQLAGVPRSVLDRASEILVHIQSLVSDKPVLTGIPASEQAVPETSVPGLFSDEEIILDEILSLDIDNVTPLMALQHISRWKKALSSR